MHPRWYPLFLFALISCGPPLTSGSQSEDGVEPDPLELACESLCARITECSTGVFADDWKFESESECVSDCVTISYLNVELVGEKCVEYGVDFWECGAAIEDCQLFQAYEDFAFGIPTLKESPCVAEQHTWLQNCN